MPRSLSSIGRDRPGAKRLAAFLMALALAATPPAQAASPSLEQLRGLVSTSDFGTIGRKLSKLVTQASARELQSASLTNPGGKKARRVFKKAIALLTQADRLLRSRRAVKLDPDLREKASALVAAALAELRSPNGGTPGGGGGGNQNCRDYEARGTLIEPRTGHVFATSTCAFDATTHQLSCHVTGTDADGCMSDRDVVHYYNSTADFVDEVAVIPFRPLLTRETSNQAATACANAVASSMDYSYDRQRRLTQVAASPSGNITTYSAWDGAGRRTTGTLTYPVSGPFVPVVTEAWSYDDTARTSTLITTTAVPRVGSSSATTVQTYDADGNRTLLTVTANGLISTAETTITETRRVCK